MKPLWTHGGLSLRSGAWDVRTERRVAPSGPPRAGFVPLRRDEAPRARSRPCLSARYPNLQGVPRDHDIVWPFKVQTQDVGMRGSIPLGLLVVHGKTWRAIFVGEPPRFRTHSFEPINLYSLILCLRRMTDCGQKPESQILGRLGFSALENAFGSPQAAPVARRQTPKRLRHQ